MLGRLFTIIVLVGAAYWYWTGPYQAANNPTYEQQLQQNAEDMKLCIRTMSFKAGATGEGTDNPEVVCAQKFNVYRHEGQWHSYDGVRPGK
jgi:hypothetical protein